jgi:hypothetical protein
MKKVKIIKLEPTLELSKVFYKNTIDAQVGMCYELQDILASLNKEINNLTDKEIVFINKKLFPDHLEFYNLENNQGQLLLPIIYTYMQPLQNDNLVCFSKFGEDQQYDLMDSSGKIIYSDARDISVFDNNVIFIQDHDLNQRLYHYDANNNQLKLIAELEKNKMYGEFKFSENRLFVDSGYYDENLEPATPFCFDNGKEYSEGLAAVSLNGKWGYINAKGEVIIDFQFGYASSFKKGIAKVLIISPTFQNPIGEWIEKECFNNIPNKNREWFTMSFPQFPKKHIIPLSVIRKIECSKYQLKNFYHDYSLEIEEDEMLNGYGTFATIDLNGNILKQEEHINLEESINQENTIDVNTNQNSWLEKITKNSFVINSIPDDLFVNKQFVKQALQANPTTFEYLRLLYSDDEEIGSFALQIAPVFCYDFLSDRLKALYKSQYEAHQEEEMDLDTSNISLSEQEDDSDLPF